MIYLDNNATTAVVPEAIEAMTACMNSGPTNPSSKHKAGECSKESVMQARGELARLLNCTPPEIVYTSCGTESNHLAVYGALAAAPERKHIVVSSVEHPSCIELFKHLETQGYAVSYLPVNEKGQIEVATVEAAIRPDTALVSVMWANNETGVIFPIEEIAALTRGKGLLFHTDAVQAVGKIPVDLKKIPIDLLSLTGHKIHAPTGIGALFIRKGVKIPPQLFGHQERARRGGTENVPGIIGLGKAALVAQKEPKMNGFRHCATALRLVFSSECRSPVSMPLVRTAFAIPRTFVSATLRRS
jgi:cysteine desulfurase